MSDTVWDRAQVTHVPDWPVGFCIINRRLVHVLPSSLFCNRLPLSSFPCTVWCFCIELSRKNWLPSGLWASSSASNWWCSSPSGEDGNIKRVFYCISLFWHLDIWGCNLRLWEQLFMSSEKQPKTTCFQFCDDAFFSPSEVLFTAFIQLKKGENFLNTISVNHKQFISPQAGGFNCIPGEGWRDLRQTHLGLGQCGGRGYWTAGTHIHEQKNPIMAALTFSLHSHTNYNFW